MQHEIWENFELDCLREDLALLFVGLHESAENVGALLGASNREDPASRVHWLDLKVTDAVHGSHLSLYVEAHALVLILVELSAVDVVCSHCHVDRLVLLDEVHRTLQNERLNATYGQNSLSWVTIG